MYLKRNAFFKILVLIVVFVISTACAPKKVRLYGVSDSMRNSVVGSALALQGKPYKNAAKGPDAFDCSGFVYYVFKQHQVFLPPPAEAQGRAGYEISRNSVRPGDLVVFRIDGDFHIGIVVGSGGEFVHASKSRGVAIDSVDAGYWHKQLVGYRSVL
jgi:peptidoglycan DL-endopeptidase CwlO